MCMLFLFSGSTFWAAQKVFRSFYIKNFAEWKHHVWSSIKADCGFLTDDDDDYDGDEHVVDGSSARPKFQPVVPQ